MRLFRKPSVALDDRAAVKRHRWIGVASILVVGVLLVATGWIFLSPFGGRLYTAHMTAAGGVRAGDDIRVAGVSVGKVVNMRLDRTEVKMTFTVTPSVFVGSDSTLEVKLLTPLGGRYVALRPDGNSPLGNKTIAASKVELPFTITDILRAAEPIVKQVDGQVIHDTFTEVAGAMNKYPDALRDVLKASNTLTASMTRMGGDYRKVLDVAKEYSSTFVTGRKQLQAIAGQLVITLRFFESKGVEVAYVLTQAAEFVRVLKRIAVFYGNALEPIINSIDDLFDITYAHPERVGQALDGVGQLLRIVMPMLHGEGIVLNDKNRIMDENHVEPRPDICVPNIFRQC
ncbi:MAG: MlaD family protein [Segniliparus sp.]|uniref:MlaD family protein n=1 Tax=Segniliparus sp. TaxID=2804064 RepID=UPI003F3C85D4